MDHDMCHEGSQEVFTSNNVKVQSVYSTKEEFETLGLKIMKLLLMRILTTPEK